MLKDSKTGQVVTNSCSQGGVVADIVVAMDTFCSVDRLCGVSRFCSVGKFCDVGWQV